MSLHQLQNDSIQNQDTLGIVLNGGSLRCAYYTGFLQYVYENKIKLDEIVTISSGIIPAIIHFSGESPEDIYNEFKGKILKDRKNMKIFSILLRELIDTVFKSDDDVRILNSKLKVISTKLPQFKPHVFDEFKTKEELFQIGSSSCSLPYLFDFPAKVNKSYFIDGVFSKKYLPDMLNTKRKIVLSSFSPIKTRLNEESKTASIGKKVSLKHYLSTFLYDEKITTHWYDKGYHDAIKILYS